MSQTTPTRQVRALIASDSETDARRAVEKLHDAGFVVTWRRVDAPGTAVAGAASGQWDVLLVDVGAPQFAARALVERLREADVPVPVIALSGAMSEQLALRLWQSGAADAVPVSFASPHRAGSAGHRCADSPPDANAAAGSGPTSSAPPAGTVLVVEDEAGVREMMRQVLERAGVRVLLAATGFEGVRIAREWTGRLDVVLSDYVMPGMSGDEVLRQVRDVHPEAALVLMSGYSAPAGPDGPAHDVLPKPFSPRDLIAAVRRRFPGSAPDSGQR